MDARLAAELLELARRRDDGRLGLRIAAFFAATTRVSAVVVPRGVRERAIRSFVWWLFHSSVYDSRVALAYAGYLDGLGARGCPGMPPR